MKKGYDKIFIEFPIYCFSYCGNEKEKLRDVILYCIADKALKVPAREIIDYCYMKASDFIYEDIIHKSIASAAEDFGFVVNSIEEVTKCWLELKERQLDYEDKYGKDAFCRMGRQLTEEVIKGNFGFREYKVLGAIQSVLGKKRIYSRITYELLSYRVMGFKTKTIANAEGYEQGELSGPQLKTSVIKLMHKGLLTTATYMFREKYYSTKIKRSAKLRELIEKKKIKNFAVRKGIEDKKWSYELKNKLNEKMNDLATYEL